MTIHVLWARAATGECVADDALAHTAPIVPAVLLVVLVAIVIVATLRSNARQSSRPPREATP